MSDANYPENDTLLQDAPVTCFLSSSISDRKLANEVRSVLTELGIAVRTTDDLPPGLDIGTSIVDAVLSAAFVCVVLADTPPLPAVMFEAGIAAGSRRPVLIVATPAGADQAPADLLSAPIIRYQEGSSQLLRDNISAYLQNVHPIAAKLTINWNVLVDEEKKPNRKPLMSNEQSLVRQIASHLDQLGAIVAMEFRIGDGRVDIAATIPALGESFNPMFVEVKRRRPPNIELNIQQLKNYMQAGNIRLGLLIYGTGASPAYHVADSVGIIILSSRAFLNWDATRMIQEITKLRNRVVHSA